MRPLQTAAYVLAGILLLAAVGVAVWYFRPGSSRDGRVYVRLGGTVVRAEVASSPAAHVRGLSGHAPLAADEGMLFLFREPAIQSFWMKDMLFPIDIIWLRGGRVVDVTADAPAPAGSDPLPIYSPKELADMVLEVPAGFAQAHGVVPGMVAGVERAE